MNDRIAADEAMAKTFIATFLINGPLREIVHPDPRSVMVGEIILEMPEIDEFNLNAIRRDILRSLPDKRLGELHALVKLGAFPNLDRMLLWISASAMKTS
jgi:hypothetical protein